VKLILGNRGSSILFIKRAIALVSRRHPRPTCLTWTICCRQGRYRPAHTIQFAYGISKCYGLYIICKLQVPCAYSAVCILLRGGLENEPEDRHTCQELYGGFGWWAKHYPYENLSRTDNQYRIFQRDQLEHLVFHITQDLSSPRSEIDDRPQDD